MQRYCFNGDPKLYPRFRHKHPYPKSNLNLSPLLSASKTIKIKQAQQAIMYLIAYQNKLRIFNNN